MEIKSKLEDLGLTPENAIVIGSGILNALGLLESKDIDDVKLMEDYLVSLFDKESHIG